MYKASDRSADLAISLLPFSINPPVSGQMAVDSFAERQHTHTRDCQSIGHCCRETFVRQSILHHRLSLFWPAPACFVAHRRAQGTSFDMQMTDWHPFTHLTPDVQRGERTAGPFRGATTKMLTRTSMMHAPAVWLQPANDSRPMDASLDEKLPSTTMTYPVPRRYPSEEPAFGGSR